MPRHPLYALRSLIKTGSRQITCVFCTIHKKPLSNAYRLQPSNWKSRQPNRFPATPHRTSSILAPAAESPGYDGGIFAARLYPQPAEAGIGILDSFVNEIGYAKLQHTHESPYGNKNFRMAFRIPYSIVKEQRGRASPGFNRTLVEITGIEPMTSALQRLRSPS